MGVKVLKDNNAQICWGFVLPNEFYWGESKYGKHFKVGFYKAISAFCVVFPK